MRIFPVLPDRGDGERFAVGAFDHVQLALGVLLVKRIDRHHAAALAIGVAEDRLVGDCLRPRIHGWMSGRVSASRGINPQVKITRNRRAVFGMTPHDHHRASALGKDAVVIGT